MIPERWHGRVRVAVFIAMMGTSLYWAVRQGRYWATQELSPFHLYIDHLNKTLPKDARVLVVAPDSERYNGQILQLNTELHPRAVFVLPPGVQTLEGAADWVRQKRLTWAVSLGGKFYDERAAFVRRLE